MEAEIKSVEFKVGIAEWQVRSSPDRIVTLGLGSCVGIALYDVSTRLGGLAHIMLPDSSQFKDISNRAKFADLAIEDMLKELVRRGGRPLKMVARIAGGAQMFSSNGREMPLLNIGERNLSMVRQVLKHLGIPIIAEDTGGNHGRTMIFSLVDGRVHIRTIGKPIRVI